MQPSVQVTPDGELLAALESDGYGERPAETVRSPRALNILIPFSCPSRGLTREVLQRLMRSTRNNSSSAKKS